MYNSKSLVLITMFHIANIVSHFKQSPFVTPPVGHSERNERSPHFNRKGKLTPFELTPKET